MPMRNSIRFSLRHVDVALAHAALNLDGTAHRRYHARELHQQSVASDPNNTAAVFRYFGLDKFAPVCLPLGERAFLVRTDQPAVASHIGRENGHEPSLHSLSPHNLLLQ